MKGAFTTASTDRWSAVAAGRARAWSRGGGLARRGARCGTQLCAAGGVGPCETSDVVVGWSSRTRSFTDRTSIWNRTRCSGRQEGRTWGMRGRFRRGKTGGCVSRRWRHFFFPSSAPARGLDGLEGVSEQRGVQHLSQGGVGGISGPWTRGPYGARDRAPW